MSMHLNSTTKRAGRPGKPVKVRTITWALDEAGDEKWKELYVKILLRMDVQEARLSSDSSRGG